MTVSPTARRVEPLELLPAHAVAAQVSYMDYNLTRWP